MSQWQTPLILASSSPRRLELLTAEGFEVTSIAPSCDDGLFTCGSMNVERWVESLSIMKAQHVRSCCTETNGTVIAADTVCVVDGQLFGQPATVDDARETLHTMFERSHEVCTGWCLCAVDGSRLQSGVEQAQITIGSIETDEVERYLSSNEWKGKAGAYNLSERIQAGWPITCIGDPTCVMGLPMSRMKLELLGEQTA